MGWKDMFATEEETQEEETQPIETVTTTAAPGAVALFEPRSFDEATEIANRIKNGSATAINLPVSYMRWMAVSRRSDII